MDDIDEFAGNA